MTFVNDLRLKKNLTLIYVINSHELTTKDFFETWVIQN